MDVKHFGDRVREERKRLDWTQEELAAEASKFSHDRRLTQDDIAKIENRHARRSIHAPAISRGLKRSLTYMLTGEAHPDEMKPGQEEWEHFGQAWKARENAGSRLANRNKPAAEQGGASSDPGGALEVRDEWAPSVKKNDREIQIPFLDSRASMGNGIALTDYVNVVEMISANRDELAKRCTFSSPANLRLLTAYGNSMSPTFSDGDVLLVDTGVTTLTVDQVYVLRRDDELFIKRITRNPVDRTLFVMSSDNRDHPPFEIRPERDGFQVLATVVSVWNFRKL